MEVMFSLDRGFACFSPLFVQILLGISRNFPPPAPLGRIWRKFLTINSSPQSMKEKMDYLVKDQRLELKYEPGKGAWTYHIQIPNTRHLVCRWGFSKVSGFIDNYRLEAKNLFTISGQDKLISINEKIRKAINKKGGESVLVTLYRLSEDESLTEMEILETFEKSGVLHAFKQLPKIERIKILDDIFAQKTENIQIKIVIKYIDRMSSQNTSEEE